MITERNLTYLYVGNVASGAQNATKLNLDAMPNGSVAVVNVANDTAIVSNAMVAGTEYQVVNKLSDGTIVRSPKVRLSQVVSGGLFTYQPPVEQVSYLGYDGTTFSGIGIPTLDANYVVSLWMHNTRGVYAQESEKKIFSAVGKTTQLELVTDLVDSATALFSEPHTSSKMVVVERAAGVTAVAAQNNKLFKFTKGSKVVTFHGTNLAASTGTVAKDDMISIPSWSGKEFTVTCDANNPATVVIGGKAYTGATDADATTVATALVAALADCPGVIASNNAAVVTITYKDDYMDLPPASVLPVTIEKGSSTPSVYKAATAATAAASFELDIPWEGPTGYAYSKADVATGTGVATITANTYGLKFTGLSQSFNPQVGYPTQVSFDVLTDSFGANGTVYNETVAFPGSGAWQGLAELEAYAQGNEVWYRNSAYPTPNYRREIQKGAGYNVITLAIQNDINVASTTGTIVGSPFTITIATEASLANYDGLGDLMP